MSKVCTLTAKSLNLLSSLDSVFRHNNMDKQSDFFSQNQEYLSNKSNILWLIERSALIKKRSYGQYVETPAIKISSLGIRKLMLYPNGKEEYNQSYVSLSVQFKDLPKNMLLEGDVSVLGKDENILLIEKFFRGTCDLKEIDIDLFPKSELNSFFVNNKLKIRCRISSISQIYKCSSGKSTYQVHNTPKIIDREKLTIGDDKFSDVILEVDSRKIMCHKFILASESRPLSILFSASSNKILDMRDKSSAVIEDLLNFIYCGHIQLFKFKHICLLYIAADEFGILNLKDICSVFLSNSLSEKNVPYILELSVKYNDQYLIEACIKFMKANNIKNLTDTFMERSLKIEH